MYMFIPWPVGGAGWSQLASIPLDSSACRANCGKPFNTKQTNEAPENECQQRLCKNEKNGNICQYIIIYSMEYKYLYINKYTCHIFCSWSVSVCQITWNGRSHLPSLLSTKRLHNCFSTDYWESKSMQMSFHPHLHLTSTHRNPKDTHPSHPSTGPKTHHSSSSTPFILMGWHGKLCCIRCLLFGTWISWKSQLPPLFFRRKLAPPELLYPLKE